MDKKVSQKIVEIITSKSWNIYYRGRPKAKIDHSETYRKGPVSSVKEGILYILLPKVNEPTSKKVIDRFIEKHQIQPKITMPSSGWVFGQVIHQFEGGDQVEDYLYPKDEVSFIGFVLRKEEIELLAPSKTFMPYDVFLEALNTLPDINGLETS